MSMTEKSFGKAARLLAAVTAAVSLTACRGIEISGKTENIAGYTEAQTMLVLGSERNRYQSVFGAEVWSLPVSGEREDNYGAYFTDKMKEFLQDIRTLNLLAEEKGIAPGSADMERLRRLTTAFYSGLTEDDFALMRDCTEQDVLTMYTSYFTACQTAEYLLQDVETEVPDADAKVIEVQQIVVSDRTQADQLWQEVNVEGANFAYYARQSSEDPDITLTLAKSEKDDLLYQTAFSLEENEISDVFEQDGKYYILKCTNAYDRKATQERKEKLEAAIRSNAFQSSYQTYADQHIIRFREDFWDSIDLSEYPDSRADNFFSLYDAEMSSNG